MVNGKLPAGDEIHIYTMHVAATKAEREAMAKAAASDKEYSTPRCYGLSILRGFGLSPRGDVSIESQEDSA